MLLAYIEESGTCNRFSNGRIVSLEATRHPLCGHGFSAQSSSDRGRVLLDRRF